MDVIPPHLLDCSFYLYESVEAAQKGEEFGGSGFLVHVPTEHEGFVALYAVTNKHVVKDGFSVLRLNTTDGAVDTISSKPESWLHNGNDVAILPLEMEGKRFKWFSIEVNRFITPDIISNYRIGPGAETVLIGRLITAEGRQRNRPVARFGNLSMMADPNEPFIRDDGEEQESFLVECRSLSGFSGSPVFVYTTQTYFGDDAPKIRETGELIPETSETEGLKMDLISLSGTFGPWLLGIDWGHLPLWRPVYENNRETETNYEVEANTGIACVVPAWHIVDILNQEELVMQRKRDNEEITGSKQKAIISDSRQ